MKHTSVIILVESLYRRSPISFQRFGFYNWWSSFHWSDFILLWLYFWSNSAHPWQYKRSTTTPNWIWILSSDIFLRRDPTNVRIAL